MAVDGTHDPAARVRSLAEHGSSVEVDPAVPIRRYFRSGQELIRMANVYHEEHNWESAFILYSKFITIFVEKLPKHPQYKGARPEDLKSSKKNLKIAFPKAEDTKNKLKLKYGEEYKIWQQQELKRRAEQQRLCEEEQRREAEKQRILQEQEEELRRLQDEREKSIMEEQIKQLDEQRNAILHEQARTREMEREQEEQKRLWMEEQERIRQQEEQRRRQAAAAAAGVAALAGGVATVGGIPSIPPPSYEMVNSIKGQGVRPQNSAVYAPTPFANAMMPDSRMLSPTAPPNNSTTPVVDRSLKVDRSTKPAHLLSEVKTRNKYGLRDLYVPADIMPKFLDIAKHNTVKNLETCGILAGRLSHDAFTITHTVVPKQTATSDSCTALNEEELFDVMDNNDLITLGWIHTHPSQTAFMSSIDLHTHCPYQLMMPEAIAIVCAPTHNETGMFSLTPDHGLRFIAKCTEKGFHPHPKHPTIYEEGEHCKIIDNVNSQVIDLR